MGMGGAQHMRVCRVILDPRVPYGPWGGLHTLDDITREVGLRPLTLPSAIDTCLAAPSGNAALGLYMKLFGIHVCLVYCSLNT